MKINDGYQCSEISVNNYCLSLLINLMKLPELGIITSSPISNKGVWYMIIARLNACIMTYSIDMTINLYCNECMHEP